MTRNKLQVAPPAEWWRAKISDHEVDLIRTLADGWRAEGMLLEKVCRLLARKFEIHPRTVRKYIYCERRTRRGK